MYLITSDRPKVPSVQYSAEPSVINSTEAELSVVPTERDLQLIDKIVINAKCHRHLKYGEKWSETCRDIPQHVNSQECWVGWHFESLSSHPISLLHSLPTRSFKLNVTLSRALVKHKSIEKYFQEGPKPSVGSVGSVVLTFGRTFGLRLTQP